MTREELSVFIDQARWLIAYHDDRGESISQRSVAVLGFTGVIFALIPTAMALPTELTLNWGIWFSLGLTMVGLLAAAILSVLTLRTRETGGPSVSQTRRLLRQHTTGERTGRVHVDVAHAFLHGMDPEKKSPVDLALDLADTKAKWFQRSTIALVFGVVGLFVLVPQLVYQAGQGVTHEQSNTGARTAG